MGSNGSGLWVGKAIYGRETSSATAATATMTASARSFAGSGASPASSPLSVSLFPGETWTDAGATFARSTSLLLTTLSLSARDVALGGGLEDDEVFGGMDATLAWVRSACAEVLERLLTVGLADEATSVRLEVVIGLEVCALNAWEKEGAARVQFVVRALMGAGFCIPTVGIVMSIPTVGRLV